MKYKDRYYLQLSRSCFERLNGLSTSTKWLYVVLIELEHRFTGPEIDWFYRSIEDLSKDSGLSRPTVIKGLKTLNAIGLIETFQEHFNNRDTGKRSEKHIAVITIL